ncbi:hypothetical protein D9M70_571220 [compost metagenome]
MRISVRAIRASRSAVMCFGKASAIWALIFGSVMSPASVFGLSVLATWPVAAAFRAVADMLSSGYLRRKTRDSVVFLNCSNSAGWVSLKAA